jgi:osmoprotectant transport system permease protein
VLGVPIGILAARRPRVGAPIVWLANVAQTIPSLAPSQLFRRIELPLALPSIVAGIRVATVIGVGTATIAAAVGAGGLGEYIFRGLSMVEPTVILAGAVPAALLALTFDGALTVLERVIRRTIESGRSRRPRALPALGLIAAVVAVAVVFGAARAGGETIRVGSKNFTEQILLGELLAQTIEMQTGMTVERRLNLGGTFICDRALRSGDIDVYVEYSGTALTAVFKQPVQNDPAQVLDTIRRLYADAGVTLLDPLGFENTFAILVRSQDAAAHRLVNIGDVARHAATWRAAFGYEFLQRADGYPGLASAYGLHFGSPPRAMDLSLIYRALADRQVDLVAGDATSGLIEAYGLTMLKDDRRYFPPYAAVPVARRGMLLAHPEVRQALATLAGGVSVDDMRRMNKAVDADHRDPADVVRALLQERSRP